MRMRFVGGLLAASLMCGAASAHARTEMILGPRPLQASNAAPAESAIRQVYEEGQRALSENRLADAEKAWHKVSEA